jgi:hypothetical protein
VQNKALPTFEQAGRFAQMIGIRTAEAWDRYIAGKTHEDLFQQVLSVINARVVQIPLEA